MRLGDMRCCCLLHTLLPVDGGDGGVTGRRIDDGFTAGEDKADAGDLGDFEAFDDDGDDSATDFGDERAGIVTVGASVAFAMARSCAGEAVADRAYLLGDGFSDVDANEDENKEAEDGDDEADESADASACCARPAEKG